MGQIVRAIDGMAEACRALDFPVVSGNVSRSTTRPTARPFRRPRPSAPSACWPTTTGAPASRRWPRATAWCWSARPTANWAPVDLSARGAGPRGRRAAAGRSGAGAPERRLRARPDRSRTTDRVPRPVRRRADRRGRRDGAGLRHAASSWTPRQRHPRPRLPVRRGPGPLPGGRTEPGRTCWRAHERPGCTRRWSATPGATPSPLPICSPSR